MNLIEEARREQARWYILTTLDSARPVGANEGLILQVLQDVPLPMTQAEIRRELDYLERRGLVTVIGRDRPVWAAELTRDGIDLCEYTIDCQPGIARPNKWF